MSDNITREPYRNAWYKQLQEEVSKIKPHLVPEVENDDNGKILVAGQEGTFGWAQPPEELPVITESDEGKVLKVDSGVPKWLEDETGLLVIVTQSGTAPNYTYTANYTYNEIKAAADAGYNIEMKIDGTNAIYHLYNIASNRVQFIRYFHNFTGTPYQDPTTHDNISNLQNISEVIFRFDANGITKTTVYYQTHNVILLSTTSGTLTDEEKWFVVNILYGLNIIYDNYRLFPYYANSTTVKFRDIANTYECEINLSTKAYAITTLSKLPIATAADEGKVLMVDANGDYTLGTVQGGSPHYAEVSLGISVE